MSERSDFPVRIFLCRHLRKPVEMIPYEKGVCVKVAHAYYTCPQCDCAYYVSVSKSSLWSCQICGTAHPNREWIEQASYVGRWLCPTEGCPGFKGGFEVDPTDQDVAE